MVHDFQVRLHRFIIVPGAAVFLLSSLALAEGNTESYRPYPDAYQEPNLQPVEPYAPNENYEDKITEEIYQAPPAYVAPPAKPAPYQAPKVGSFEGNAYARERVGGPLPGLSPDELALFNSGLAAFSEARSVQGPRYGLGPRFNSDSCLSCHAFPAVGGSSPPVNPLFDVARRDGANNIVPFFLQANGPIREARLRYIESPNGMPTKNLDGRVVNLFTISGRRDARGCRIAQPDFARSAKYNNLVFRIPTPVFGGGLIEAITDKTILTSFYATARERSRFGIYGRPNLNASDGTVNRFGWKAQVKSLLEFSGEAYKVEMGVTNELFPNENGDDRCLYNANPEDLAKVGSGPIDSFSDISKLAAYMRLTAPPPVLPLNNSAARGRELFSRVGCVLCHTPGLAVGSSYVESIARQKVAYLYSDLLVHRMGWRLEDGIYQGNAGPDEWRTAPLWGVGQRRFFLHDGRAGTLVEAIDYHHSDRKGPFPPSEANLSVDRWNRLSPQAKQDLLNFLKSL